jgi:hypothetical protein
LEVLGQKFPKKVTKFHIATEFMRCHGKLRGKSDDDILSLPEMEDTMKLTAIQLIILIAFWANSVRKQLAPLLSVRVVMLTLNYGMNDMCKAFDDGYDVCARFEILRLTLLFVVACPFQVVRVLRPCRWCLVSRRAVQ